VLASVIQHVRLRRASEWERIDFFRGSLGGAGERIRIVGEVSFGSEPFLVHLGSDVTITDGVRFVTHDGGVAVFRHEHPDLDVFAPIHVGSRVFIGVQSIIMPGVTIGDDVVIGAGSVVTKDVPSGVVAAGTPCRQVTTLDEYRDRALEIGVRLPRGIDPAERRRRISESVERRST
jgi:acetyltransferase-like isoleucine patch superfamily enzyme